MPHELRVDPPFALLSGDPFRNGRRNRGGWIPKMGHLEADPLRQESALLQRVKLAVQRAAEGDPISGDQVGQLGAMATIGVLYAHSRQISAGVDDLAPMRA